MSSFTRTRENGDRTRDTRDLVVRGSLLRVKRHLVVDRESYNLTLDRARYSLRRTRSYRTRHRCIRRSVHRLRRFIRHSRRVRDPTDRRPILSICQSPADNH